MSKLIKRLKSQKIRGKNVQFDKRKSSGFTASKFAGKKFVQAYVNNRPYASGKTKADAISQTRRNMRIEKKWKR